MNSTAYTRKPWFRGRVAVPTNAEGKEIASTFGDHANAADLVYSTPRDYAAFMIDVASDRHLATSVAYERDRSQVSMKNIACKGAKAASCPPLVGFGLGWQILGFADATLMMHTGKDDGVFTFAYIDRSDQSGAVIFTNSENGCRIVLPLLERLHARPAFLRFLRGQIE